MDRSDARQFVPVQEAGISPGEELNVRVAQAVRRDFGEVLTQGRSLGESDDPGSRVPVQMGRRQSR
ncbi:MAG: hypothetical protein HPY55_05695 [Firmicutes bacterium]|nr:hypothetical protein [Bacillota bacterium]